MLRGIRVTLHISSGHGTWDSCADAALSTYGNADVTRRLAPAMRGVNDADATRRILSSKIADCNGRGLPPGRWAVVEARTHTVVGGVALLLLPPTEEDLEIGWQVAPAGVGSRSANHQRVQALSSNTTRNGLLVTARAQQVRVDERGDEFGQLATGWRYGNVWVKRAGSGAIPVPSGEFVSNESMLSITLSRSDRPLNPV